MCAAAFALGSLLFHDRSAAGWLMANDFSCLSPSFLVWEFCCFSAVPLPWAALRRPTCGPAWRQRLVETSRVRIGLALSLVLVALVSCVAVYSVCRRIVLTAVAVAWIWAVLLPRTPFLSMYCAFTVWFCLFSACSLLGVHVNNHGRLSDLTSCVAAHAARAQHHHGQPVAVLHGGGSSVSWSSLVRCACVLFSSLLCD